MLLSVALFQGFLGLLSTFWPKRSIGVSLWFSHFSRAFGSGQNRSRSCFPRRILDSARSLVAWQRVRDSNLCALDLFSLSSRGIACTKDREDPRKAARSVL